MKAIGLHAYHEQPVVEDVSEPDISGPMDVIVEIGGAGGLGHIGIQCLAAVTSMLMVLARRSMPYTILTPATSAAGRSSSRTTPREHDHV